MAQLYLVAFKEQNYGTEPEVNYALRELLDEHCSYCTPACKTEVFGPHTPEQSLAEICWLLQEVGYTQLAYHDLIDLLREKYEKVNGYKTPSWYETFYGREIQRQDEVERKERVDRWKSDRNWIFRTLISKWVKPRKR
ncbi:hypothetical protein [Synechococcus sp. A15-127]|uniref:hypothetical protein n=1 Tax=Synechococcus sp. A15-127 TaxID=1050624 RepID=UPI0016471F22|nr:hypothetical protein [Synechococcus sp. A15-127]